MGQANANRMLGEEGWKPTAKEALEVGLIQWLAPHDRLADEARQIASQWAASGKTRSFRGGSSRDELKTINANESVALADAFLNTPFLRAQFRFLWGKKKWATGIDVPDAVDLQAALVKVSLSTCQHVSEMFF